MATTFFRRMMSGAFGLSTVLLAGCTLSLAAQTAPSADLEPVAARLHTLVEAEDDYYEIYNVFADDLSSLLMPAPPGIGVADVNLQVVYAGVVGWIALGWRESQPYRQCVLFFGDLANLPDLPATSAGTLAHEQGRPACDP